MARRKIVWSLQAKNNRVQILEYWIEHNNSSEYSRKLNTLFKQAAELISEYPSIGKLSGDKQARIKIVRDYWIVYDVSDSMIFILAIFDSRQNPIKLKY
jgi:toxin YoeB